ncbi:MAG: glucose 1-dehydrogenase [Pseudomonadota bacterium]
MGLDQFRLDGKVALITGGNRGIGLGITSAFCEAGAKCLITARRNNPEAVAALSEAGYTFEFVSADVTDPEVPERLVDRTVETFGSFDILVNNAGVAIHCDMPEFDDSKLESQMSTNFDQAFRLSRAALKPMQAQQHGVIVNIGSISALIANIPQRQVAYNASKAAVHMMTKCMASDYAADGIRVNAVAPGYIDTDMTRPGIDRPDWDKVWADMTPIGRYGTPADVANCALFLASPASAFVTGAILVVDGGYTTR